MLTRRTSKSQNQNLPKMITGGTKRPLDADDQGNQRKKRVFGDITNRDNNKPDLQKKVVKKVVVTKNGKPRTVLAVAKSKHVVRKEASDTIAAINEEDDVLKSSQTSVKSEDVSWDILDLSVESKSSQNSNSSNSDTVIEDPLNDQILSEDATRLLEMSNGKMDDIDEENLKDPYLCSLYSRYIFNYYKARESKFELSDYLSWQTDLTPHMRGILVDWLVEVQESFELNHETLYLAIKLVDFYINKNKTLKDRLQLIGATALFIACKFEERIPPMLDDFVYICDDSYQRNEFIEMEQKVLRTVDFDLGIPLSYRFLRRYSKCARSMIVTLTLSRYILETSQMDYSFVQIRDSHRAAACLLLAMKMDKSSKWTETMVFYTGYTEKDLLPLCKQLNNMITAQPASKLSTIRLKYSHRVFHEVAKIAPLDVVELDSSISEVLANTPQKTPSTS